MTLDEPPDHAIEAVNMALDEDDVRVWLEQWRAAPPLLRHRMETEIALAAVRRNHLEVGPREDRARFWAIVRDEPSARNQYRRPGEGGSDL